MKNTKGLTNNSGMTLVELLVAMVVGMILLGGVYVSFVSSTTTNSMNEQLSRMQENGRFATEVLTRSIRMAGFRGCDTFGPLTNTLKEQGTLPYNHGVAIEGFNNVSAPLPAYLTAASISPLLGTDVIIIRGNADNDTVRVVKNNSSAQIFLEVTTQEPNACSDGTTRVSGICQGDILMITDCSKSRIFQAGNITVTGGGGTSELNVTHPSSGTPGNDPTSWGGASAPPDERFGPDSEVVKYVTRTYFVQNNPAGVPALFEKENANPAREIVEGIENMQIRYGEDTTGNRAADVYVTADGVTDWDSVVSVRVGLLLRSPNDLLRGDIDTATYSVNGTDIDAPGDDRRLRMVMSTTTGIRNRLR